MIRKYQSEDLPVIMDIANQAWQPIYDMYEQCLGTELFKLRTPKRQSVKGEQVKQHCSTSPDKVLICEENGRIVGFLTYFVYEDRSTGEIGNNAVDTRCGLKGIGQQMYQAALEIFRQQGLKFAEVSTGLDPAHAPARRAYERAGFDVSIENVTYFKKL